MLPEICKIGSFTVYSYGLMLVVAFIAGVFLASRRAVKENVSPDTIFNLAFVAFLCGVIGARAFYISENLGYYLKNPVEIIMLQHGGLSWFGGLILGFLSALIYLKANKLPIYKILDLIAPFLVLAQAIGRIGCLLNGCCYGKISGFGIYFKTHQAVLVPTQIYSTLALILIFVILRLLQDRPHKEGQVFFLYLFLYSIKRFFIEFWRADNPSVFFGLTLFQVLSVIVFFLSAIRLLQIKRSKKT